MKRTLAIGAFLVLAVMAGQANATEVRLTVGPSGNLIIGEVVYPGAIADVNGLLPMDKVAVDTLTDYSTEGWYNVLGKTEGNKQLTVKYYRSGNSFGTLPDVVGSTNEYGDQNGGDHQIKASFTVDGIDYLKITLPSRMTYLMATWDGPNVGGEVWYIGGLEAGREIWVPYSVEKNDTTSHLFDHTDSTRQGITSWTAWNPTTSVPDGGATVMLLGLALSGLGLVSRRMK